MGWQGQATDENLEEMNQNFESAVESDEKNTDDPNAQSNAGMNTAPELKVVEGKEGPNNEVVYEYQNDYFYVDREEKKLVKVEKSELQDANHEVIVKDGSEEDNDENASSSNRK